MAVEVRDKYYVMVFLLEECNFSCSHCVRDDEPMRPGYKLSFDQHKLFLADCARLESVRWVEHSGGETTLWQDGDHGLVDVLIAESRAGLEPGFTSNGGLLADYAYCRDLLQRYFAAATMPLRVYLSIDVFHDNLDAETGRAPSLDNVLRYRDSLPSAQREMLTITPLTAVSKDPASLPPDEMLHHYESLGAPFRILPLRAVGKARDKLAHLCPDLGSDRPEDLGAYYPFRPEQSRKEPPEAPTLVLIGDTYWFSADDWRIAGRLGHLPDEIIAAYAEPGVKG